MLHKVFAIHDVKAGAYLQPFFAMSRGTAIRAFSDHARDASTPVGQHPEDYTLFELGTFDDHDAHFDLLDIAEPLGKALHFLQASGDSSSKPKLIG